MQHPCHQCGAPVEDGTPFCKQCNAPQIRVASMQPPQSETIEPLRRPEPQETAAEPAPPPLLSRAIEWRSAFPAALFVAVPAGLLSFPLNILFFLWTFGAGVLTVSSYRKRTRTGVTPGMAARLGLFSGAVAFAVFLVVFLIAMQRPEFGPPLRQEMKAALERQVEKSADPNARKVADMLTSPDGFATLFTMVILLFAVLFIIFSVMGAIAGATVFAPKNRAP
jgi:hypothetical protein